MARSHPYPTPFGVVTDRHDEGHAVYLNPLGDVAFLDCHFHHNGGQAIQLDLPRKPGRENGSIHWTTNRGEARVFWRGDYVGPAWQDLRVRDGKLERVK